MVECEPKALFPIVQSSHNRNLLAYLGHHIAFELCECRAIALRGGRRSYTRGQDQCRRYVIEGGASVQENSSPVDCCAAHFPTPVPHVERDQRL